jgi:hypothetical protein
MKNLHKKVDSTRLVILVKNAPCPAKVHGTLSIHQGKKHPFENYTIKSGNTALDKMRESLYQLPHSASPHLFFLIDQTESTQKGDALSPYILGLRASARVGITNEGSGNDDG